MTNMKPVNENEKTAAALDLMNELAKGEKSAQEKDWTDIAEVEKLMGVSETLDAAEEQIQNGKLHDAGKD